MRYQLLSSSLCLWNSSSYLVRPGFYFFFKQSNLETMFWICCRAMGYKISGFVRRQDAFFCETVIETKHVQKETDASMFKVLSLPLSPSTRPRETPRFTIARILVVIILHIPLYSCKVQKLNWYTKAHKHNRQKKNRNTENDISVGA